jgi:hypothetical protein
MKKVFFTIGKYPKVRNREEREKVNVDMRKMENSLIRREFSEDMRKDLLRAFQ